MLLKSYLFIRDEDRTRAYREKKRRTYLFGILSFLIGIVFLVLEVISLAALFGILGMILMSIGQFILAYTPDKGAFSGNFMIDSDQITILDNSYKIKELENLSFSLVTYDGGPSFDRYKNAEGNENEISYSLNGKSLKMNFYIPTIKHYVDLIDYLEENNINFRANRGFPWT